MGDHRATSKRARLTTWVRVLLVLTALSLVVIVLLKVLVDRNEVASGIADPYPSAANASSSQDPVSPAPAISPSPSASTSASASPSSAPKASKSPSPSPGTDLPRLAPTSARRLVIGSLIDSGFDAVVAPIGGRLSPRTRDAVARWGDRGLPGNPSDDTVVLVGSTRDSTASLWGLEQVRRGATITLTTGNGLVSYVVDSRQTLSSTAAASSPLLQKVVPGRLVLLGARYDSAGVRAAQDLILVATLSSVVQS
ncbi:MAG: hypothetical protein ABIN79_03630 [Marmoricola sp.]